MNPPERDMQAEAERQSHPLRALWILAVGAGMLSVASDWPSRIAVGFVATYGYLDSVSVRLALKWILLRHAIDSERSS